MDINIKTTLGINPRRKPRELLAITRGASFSLEYALPVGFSYNVLEQLTFTFKQKQTLYCYRMFHYLIPTSASEIDEAKRYYKNAVYKDITSSYECTAEYVENPQEDPTAEYYEEVLEPDFGQNDLRYFIDPHFGVTEDGKILFIFSATETSLFTPTPCGAEIKFEIALRANTDNNTDTVNQDLVLIDTQPNIIVKDSLYGQVSADTNTVTNSPERLASTRRTVRGE